MTTRISNRIFKVTCGECDRTFDLYDEEQAAEWYGGHDCEEVEE